jgi:hypothetical protein
MNLYGGQYETIEWLEKGKETVLLDVGDFLLLLVVCLHLIDFVLRPSPDKR